jgi:hypothetical protein
MYSLWKVSSVEAANLFDKLAALRASEPAGEIPNEVRDLSVSRFRTSRCRRQPCLPFSRAVINGMQQTMVDDV